MATVKLVFALLATIFILMLSMKTVHVEAADCNGVCSPFEMPPCRSSDCRCIPIALVMGYCRYPSSVSNDAVTKMAKEHPNLCQTHADCKNKRSGSFCARYPNPDIEYGWCFVCDSEAKTFFANALISEAKGSLKMHGVAI